MLLIPAVPAYSTYDGGHSTHEATDDPYLYEFQPGMDYNSQEINTANSLQSLFPASSISVKANGTKGQVNTLTLDGGPASQTRLAFDGHVIDFGQIPIFDASLLPLDLMSEVEVYQFNFSPLGISASSGIINFKLRSGLQKRLQASLSAGSFANYQGSLLFRLGNKSSVQHQMGLSYNQADNQFIYLDTYNNTNIMSNMDYKKISFIHKLVSPHIESSSSLTWKEGGTGNKFSDTSRQEDLFFISGWKSTSSNINIKGHYSYWRNQYQELPASDIHENHQLLFHLGKSLVLSNYTFRVTGISKTSYLSSTRLDQVWDEDVTLSLENQLDTRRMLLKLDLAESFSLLQGFALLPALAATLKLHPLISMDLRVSRVFQRPSFNDLYWPADSWSQGNPDLEPEQGWKYKIAGRLFLHPVKLQFSFTLSDLDQIILWGNQSGKWRPENLGKTLAYTTQGSLEYTTVIKNLLFQVVSSLSWNRSLNNNDSSLYYLKNTVYSPEIKANLSLLLSRREKWQGALHLRYTSGRYITEDNSVSLPPYLLLDLHLQYRIVFVNINNILDQRTEEIQGYPQPGININAGINIKI